MTRELVLTVMAIAALALVAGGIVLIRRGRDRRKGVLMLICAAVLLADTALWIWPA